jgi:hypothetical protein
MVNFPFGQEDGVVADMRVGEEDKRVRVQVTVSHVTMVSGDNNDSYSRVVD